MTTHDFGAKVLAPINTATPGAAAPNPANTASHVGLPRRFGVGGFSIGAMKSGGADTTATAQS